ncbi:MAG: DUF438 domain-containing protein [Candidatus Bipolaricaulis sp.]
MSEMMGNTRKEALKEILHRLHAGESPQRLKAAFRDAVGNVSPQEIAQLEDELVREGLPREELLGLCDLHLSLFEEALANTEVPTPPWHPVGILMAEHRELLRIAEKLKSLTQGQGSPEELAHIREHLEESERHYLREENVLFPMVEKHGVVEPPRVLWNEHQEIRKLKKGIQTAAGGRLRELSVALGKRLSSHFLKENRILFPTALQVIPEGEWHEIRAQFDEIGYCCFTPAAPVPPVTRSEPGPATEGRVRLPTGEFTAHELEAVLNTLPVDITFVDKDDTVRYFNQTKDRIFVRTPAVIGRKVQDCHPQKSVHIVDRILREFREGKRDEAEFWLPLQGKLVYIRYFPVRGTNGEYLGTVEVTQDIGPLQRISGERRLLDD